MPFWLNFFFKSLVFSSWLIYLKGFLFFLFFFWFNGFLMCERSEVIQSDASNFKNSYYETFQCQNINHQTRNKQPSFLCFKQRSKLRQTIIGAMSQLLYNSERKRRIQRSTILDIICFMENKSFSSLFERLGHSIYLYRRLQATNSWKNRSSKSKSEKVCRNHQAIELYWNEGETTKRKLKTNTGTKKSLCLQLF